MPSVSTAYFCKRKTCPPAERLLAYYMGTLTSDEEQRETLQHLAQCDFCDAEIALLAKCPPTSDDACGVHVEMPASLRLLAKALLRGTARHDGDHTETLLDCERLPRERLMLTDA